MAFSLKKSLILPILLICFINCDNKKLFNEIIDVDETNLDLVYRESDNLLFFFFQDNCAQCIIFKNVITNIFKEIRKLNLNINLIRIDITENSKMGSLFEIDNVPTVKLVETKFNMTSVYKGDPNVNSIIEFLRQKAIKNFTQIESINELYYNSKKHMIVFCDYKNNSLFESAEFENLLHFYSENVNFTWTNSAEIMNKFNCKSQGDDIILFSNKEEIKRFNESKESLEDWLRNELIPLIDDLSFEKLHYILDNNIPSLIYLIKYTDDYFTSSYNLFYQISKKFKDIIVFLSSLNSNQDVINMIQEMIVIKPKDMPMVIGINYVDNKMILYRLEKKNFVEKELNLFVENFINKGKNYLLYVSETQNEKEKQRKVQKFYGNTIKRKIIESKRDVLVFVDQSISCSYCKKLSHSFKRLSQHLKETNITFGKIDYYYNDIPEFQFKLPFPKLLLFPHDPKSANKYYNYKIYEGDFNIKQIMEFIMTNTFYPINQILNSEDYPERIIRNVILIDQALDYNKVSDEIERQITYQISKLNRKGESEEKIPEDESENTNNSENTETISNDENYNKIKDDLNEIEININNASEDNKAISVDDDSNNKKSDL